MSSPIGPLTLAEHDGALTHLLFNGEVPKEYIEGESELLQKAEVELSEYFEGARREFDLPLEPSGTEFQQRVWAALLDIPYGETRSYKDIAIAAGCLMLYPWPAGCPRGFWAWGWQTTTTPSPSSCLATG